MLTVFYLVCRVKGSLMRALTGKLDTVIALYRVELGKADRGEEFQTGPWFIAGDIPQTVFEAWVATVLAVWRLSYEIGQGNVLLYGDPLPPHARTAGWFLVEFASAIEENFGKQIRKSLFYSTDEDYSIPGYGIKVPDLCIVPRRRGQVPCVVAEVGYHNEQNFQRVREEVDLWVTFGVPIVIGVKITDTGRASTEDPLIEVIVKIQGYEDQLFRLSHQVPTPCVGEGTHQIFVPTGLLLNQAHRASTPAVEFIHIDLFDLQSNIREWVRSRA
jgi:hypothetical protein